MMRLLDKDECGSLCHARAGWLEACGVSDVVAELLVSCW